MKARDRIRISDGISTDEYTVLEVDEEEEMVFLLDSKGKETLEPMWALKIWSVEKIA